MKVTNSLGLPQALVRAVSHDRYDGGHGDISVTTLIAPAQQRLLKDKHEDDLVEDAAERIWSVIGSAIHYLIENAAETMKAEGEWDDETCIMEERFYHEYRGKVISGQIDLYEKRILTDFKVTSVWTIKDALQNGKEEWEAQLNLQRWLMRNNGIDVDGLQITAIARDWRRGEALRDPDYPMRAENIIIDIWSDEKLDAYMQSRMNDHFGKVIPPCTPKECWEKPTMYALMKEGRKSALRVLDSESNIMDYAAAKGLTNDKDELVSKHYIDQRIGDRMRCREFCVVSDFCEQFKDWKSEMDKALTA